MTFGRVVLVFVTSACYSLAVFAEPASTTPTVDAIRELLRVNGNGDIAAQIGPVVAQQLNLGLHRTNPNLPARADAVVTNVVVA